MTVTESSKEAPFDIDILDPRLYDDPWEAYRWLRHNAPISMDDPEHTRQRRLVSKGFTPRMVRQLSDHVRDLSNQIIDEISAKGACDFVEDIAIHVRDIRAVDTETVERGGSTLVLALDRLPAVFTPETPEPRP